MEKRDFDVLYEKALLRIGTTFAWYAVEVFDFLTKQDCADEKSIGEGLQQLKRKREWLNVDIDEEDIHFCTEFVRAMIALSCGNNFLRAGLRKDK